MKKYFGTDGVRGVANSELTPEIAFKLGRYGGYVLSQHLPEDEQPQVVVGRDTRMSGKLLEFALVAGLVSIGADVLRAGVIPTPGLAYLTRVQGAAAGVMISASHNPASDNGIKFFGGDGYKLSDEQEAEIESLLNAEEDNLPRPSAEGLGEIVEYKEGILKYTQFLTSAIDTDLSDMHFVVDGANGATSYIIDRVFADLDADIETIATNPDGLNINAGVGSTHPEQLAQKVVETGAQAGFAYDGDGDRFIAVDEKGNIVDGDKIMFIIAKQLRSEGRLKHETVVTTVMSNMGLYKSLEKEELKSVQTKVGDRHVVEEMRKNGYNFGGEQSGHIVFNDMHTTGDGLLTSIQLARILKKSDHPLSELAEEMEVYPQKLVNVRVSDKYDYMGHENIKQVVEKVTAELGDDGRLLVRASGTEPLLRIMVEAQTQADCDRYCNEVAAVVKDEIGIEETER